MTVTTIAEALKAGPSISEVARNLGVSRAALYRQMELFDKGDRDGMNRDVLEYFTKVFENTFETKEQAVQYLSQIRELREAKSESEHDRYSELRRRVFSLNRELMEAAGTMSQEEYVKKAADLEKHRTELKGLEDSYMLSLRRARFREHAESKWVTDEGIRTAVINTNDGAMLVIDAKYEVCQTAVVDLYVEIEGQMTAIARRRPHPDERYVHLDRLQMGLTYGYTLTWTDGNTVRTTDIHEFRAW